MVTSTDKDKQTSPAPDNSGPGREAARVGGAQVMNRQIGGRDAFVNLELSEDGEGSRRINQRSNRAAMNHTLILLQFVADIQVNTDHSLAYFSQFEAE